MDCFKGFREGRLDSKGNLVLVSKSGQTVSRPLGSLSGDEFVVVTKDCTAKLLQLVSKEVVAIVEAEQPELLLRISLAGGRLLIFDWRSYHLSIRNAGGDSRDVRVSAKILTASHRYEPLELRRGAETDLDLREFHGLGREETVKVEVRFKDAGIKEYKGSMSVELESKEWQKLPLQGTCTGPPSERTV
jgi:hypothetical protein